MSCRNQIPYKMVGAMPMDGLALGRPATMFAHEMPRLRNRDDSNGPGRPLRQTGHHRRVRQLPGVLVRSVREPATVSWLDTETYEVHRRTLVAAETISAGRAPLSAMCNDTA